MAGSVVVVVVLLLLVVLLVVVLLLLVVVDRSAVVVGASVVDGAASGSLPPLHAATATIATAESATRLVLVRWGVDTSGSFALPTSERASPPEE